jgi:hypothetical protein
MSDQRIVVDKTTIEYFDTATELMAKVKTCKNEIFQGMLLGQMTADGFEHAATDAEIVLRDMKKCAVFVSAGPAGLKLADNYMDLKDRMISEEEYNAWVAKEKEKAKQTPTPISKRRNGNHGVHVKSEHEDSVPVVLIQEEPPAKVARIADPLDRVQVARVNMEIAKERWGVPNGQVYEDIVKKLKEKFPLHVDDADGNLFLIMDA